jgi:hypothetical protein
MWLKKLKGWRKLAIFRRHLMRWHSGNLYVSQFLDDWDELVYLSHGDNVSRKLKQESTVWELLERVIPIQGRNKKDDEWIVIRILRNKVEDRKYLDIRIFRKEAEEFNGVKKEKLKKTSKGKLLPLNEWRKYLPTIIKLVRKYE